MIAYIVSSAEFFGFKNWCKLPKKILDSSADGLCWPRGEMKSTFFEKNAFLGRKLFFHKI